MTSPTPATPFNPFALIPLPALDNTLGALLLGSYFGIMLYGLTLHQAYRYSRLYPDDVFSIKILVYGVVIFETFHTILCMHMNYFYMTTNYFNPIVLLSGSWSVDLLPISAGSAIIVAQCFFVRRAYMRPQFRIPVMIAVALLFGELAFCAAATAEAFIQPTFEAYKKVIWLISVGFGMAVVADGLLTTSLIIALRRSRTGIRRTDSVIDVLVLYAITTGLLTSIFNTLAFLFASILPDNLIYVGVNMVASKLYATSFFAALNSRQALAVKGSGASTDVYGTVGGLPNHRHVLTVTDNWRVAQVGPTGTSNTALENFETKPHLEDPDPERGTGEHTPGMPEIVPTPTGLGGAATAVQD